MRANVLAIGIVALSAWAWTADRAALALAGPLDTPAVGPRSVARAGGGMVSADDGAALLVNPGGLVRRESLRLQLGALIDDQDRSFQTDLPEDALRVRDRGEPSILPYIAVQAPLGPLVVGLTYLDPGAAERRLPVLDATSGSTREDADRFFPHRYGGTALSYRRRSLVAGAAWHPLPWLGVGASVGLGQLRLAEVRHIWAGMETQNEVGDPTRDLVLDLSGSDAALVEAHVGALIAPLTVPIEIAFSVSMSEDARLDGDAALGVALLGFASVSGRVQNPTAALVIPGPLTMRAGVRYLGEPLSAEVSGEISFADAPSAWTLSGVGVTDSAGASAVLTEAPALLEQRDYGAVRVSADLAVVPGFLWLQAGYGYRLTETRPGEVTPLTGGAELHTVAFGAEANRSGVTLAVGYARQLGVGMSASSDDAVLNPYGAGTRPVTAGRFIRSADTIGMQIELTWE